MLISFFTYSLLLISLTLIIYIQLVTSHKSTVNNMETMQNQQSTVLINNAYEKFKRAYKVLEFYLLKEIPSFRNNLLPEQMKELMCQYNFKELKGILSAFFDSNNILISTIPYDIESKEELKCKWKFYIHIDGVEIIDGNFPKREQAEFISFQKAFQFLDTKLFIKDTESRFYDETSDSSCLNVNWKHLDKVLSYKRKMN